MSTETSLTAKFTEEFLYHHFSDTHSNFFRPTSLELNEFLFPLKDSLDRKDYEAFEVALFSEVDAYAYTSYQNGFKDGVRHFMGMLQL